MSNNCEEINQKVAEHFNKRGGAYSKAWTTEAKKRLSGLELEIIKKAISQAQDGVGGRRMKTLDIGVGNGRISDTILQYDVEHHGIDISQSMVDYCKDRFKDNEKVKQMMVYDIINPLPDTWKDFDLVSAMRVLTYTPFWQEMVANIYQSMSPGGIFIFTLPNRYSSIFISKLWMGKRFLDSNEVSIREAKKGLKKIGFSEYKIVGLNKLLDVFYDLCDSKPSANILFAIEKLLKGVFGSRFLSRELYIICKK